MGSSPPEAIAFRCLPLVVRVSTMLTLFMAWVLFAELIIDRHGLDVYLLYHRLGSLYLYDIAAVALLIFYWIQVHPRDHASGG